MDSILAKLPRVHNPNVLIGFETADDAGIYKLSQDCALVQTLDFFPPMVDDPYTFGAIVAANALSDVYAMGGRPVSALSILSYPNDGDINALSEILRGGVEKLREADTALLGGHSISESDIKFGYAITGLINPEKIKSNAGARPGDVVVLTKALGTGIIASAAKSGKASNRHVSAAIDSMLQLNRRACEVMLTHEAHACTDVTGFGLMGHGREIAMASNVTVLIDISAVPILPGVEEYLALGDVSASLKQNKEYISSSVAGDPPDVFYDPQTSGGLLVCMDEENALRFEMALPGTHRIGQVLPYQGIPIRVH